MNVIASEQTAIHVVTLLEEMPVQETLDGVNELAAAGLPVGGIFVNMTRPPQLDSQQRSMAIAGELPKLEIESEISQSGLTPTTQLIAALITEASDHAERVELEETELERLISRGLPILSCRSCQVGLTWARFMNLPQSCLTRALVGSNNVALDIDAILTNPDKHIIVCTGSGGVGKTTTAAALGLRAAELGRNVCVLTIDPARRLAQAMGLNELDNTPRPVAGISNGSLSAMMLDMKRTFDEVVESHSDPERAEKILSNPFYQALSSSFAGTQEYMAMENLGNCGLTHRSGT